MNSVANQGTKLRNFGVKYFHRRALSICLNIWVRCTYNQEFKYKLIGYMNNHVFDYDRDVITVNLEHCTTVLYSKCPATTCTSMLKICNFHKFQAHELQERYVLIIITLMNLDKVRSFYMMEQFTCYSNFERFCTVWKLHDSYKLVNERLHYYKTMTWRHATVQCTQPSYQQICGQSKKWHKNTMRIVYTNPTY